ncbi:carbon-nitrogen hydrolase family protein [Mycobacterium sp. CVI_P3]|uniref:Carbon-nitrogen hydrolase family protein n=1 Tax=Mycobacterium pinniadriaticum TaxID=2994102 RepID=A0ABT3S9R5_9MYCO|nr:carbon-nitrogen hydrolase family protein [Mycobacterium pinniadriaticum]MCX2929465.1 carbon-nitrogen hydrolase family protein [Mycobacterium pinniadriaticum]MCX2935889.1 carbon-nitrogen hydrolase family protein [Mycobacterium pinniadriaticum]
MPKQTMIRAAAVQLEAEVGDIDANLTMCEALINDAAVEGASWIALPEFFSTGVANLPELAENAPSTDGAPTQLLRAMAQRHNAYIGGSTLVRDHDGHVRNAYFLAGPSGRILGRHNKDIPTMWENRLYIGGDDPGRLKADDLTVGVALCWELMRTQTAIRLAGQVDLVMSGSGWWSIPMWHPKRLFQTLQKANERRAIEAAGTFAPFVGVPVIHGAHCGTVSCPWPLSFLIYQGHFQGGAMICDHRGRLIAARYRSDGPGVVVADVILERADPQPTPRGYWLQQRGSVAAVCWEYQNRLGRWQYRGARPPKRSLETSNVSPSL